MILINEWLPNPVGNDAEGEWVELFNSSDVAVSLVGWELQSKDGKSVALGGSIGSHEYIGFRRQSVKVTLHNVDGELTLYSPSGVADRQSFFGEAPEGKSFARTKAGTYLF